MKIVYIACICAVALNISSFAQQIPFAARSPYSGSVLVARAIRSHALSLPASAQSPIGAIINCKVAPCLLPNVQVSEGGYPVNETPMVASPANNRQLLAAANDYNCASLQGIYVSSNAGGTWRHACMEPLPGQFGAGDPALAFDSSGKAYIAGIDCVLSDCSTTDNIVLQRSSTQENWMAPVIAVQPTLSGGFVDKPWLAVDGSKSSPYRDRLYLSATQFGADGSSEISVSFSDGGAVWRTVVVDALQQYPTVDQFSDVATGPDGTVYLSWMRCYATGPNQNCGGAPAAMMIAVSHDGGASWTAGKSFADVTLVPDTCNCGFYGNLPNTGERMSNVPVLGVDTTSGGFAGRVYAAFYTWTGEYMLVQVTHSDDRGMTWTTPISVVPSSDEYDQFFPWIAVNNRGSVAITFLDRRNDEYNIFYDAFAAFSTDGGASFANVRMSAVTSDPYNDGFNGLFMGDYTGNAWAGRVLYMTYADTRGGANAQDELAGYIP